MRTLLLSAFLIIWFSVDGQHRRLIEFGTVTTEELKMSVYEKDSSATAVVLHDKGHFDGNEMKFTRHLRLKVLSPGGVSFGNFTVRVPAKSFIDGYTFNLENGLLRKTKLENANIHNEEIVDGFDVYKVFFPEVKPGSVIDFRYTHIGLPFEWRFQDVIPVRYSEIKLEPTNYIKYKKVFYGFEKVTTLKEDEYTAEFMPAIKIEPLMNHYSNYVTRLQFDVEKISAPRWNYYREFSSKWEKVGQRLMEDEYFGGIIRGSNFLNEIAREIGQSQASDSEKIDKAVNYVRENIKWDKNATVIASRSFREDFKIRHSGNSATINLLLIALLKKVGVNAYPVVLSTRDNGMINPLSASMNKLNYVLAGVQDKENFTLIDASDPHTVPGVLPDRCLNLAGWVIEGMEHGRPIDLTPDRSKGVKRFIMIRPNDANELVAEVTTSYEGYAYLDWIKDFEKSGSAAMHGEGLRSKYTETPIDSYTLVSQDKRKLKASERVTLKLSGTSHLHAINDDELVVNPFVFNDLTNPFNSELRSFPIDFIHPMSRSIVISMQVPGGYRIKAFPQSSRVDFPGDKAKFQFLCNVSGDVLNVRLDFVVNETLFVQDEYHLLRAFYTEVLKKISESVQIVKAT